MDHFKKGVKGKKRTIELTQYDSDWTALFEKEAEGLQKALGSNCLAIHHIGSTAIPGIKAKPVIDILAEVKELALLDVAAIEKMGFEYRGEVIVSGRYCSKENPRVHLHIFEAQNPMIKRQLSFRDWMRKHPEDRKAYEELKEQLARQHTDGVSYARAKNEFVENILEKAVLNRGQT